MSAGDYVHVPRPWKATIDTRSPLPARFYTAIISQALRYGMPSRRKFGPALAFVARRHLFPEKLAARSVRLLRGSARPELDEIVHDVVGRWSELAGRSARLPADPPVDPTLLALHRSAGLTLFVFGDAPAPLVVLKAPTKGDDRVQVEMDALQEAEEAAIAPRALGIVGDARAQEGISGSPLEVQPVDPSNAPALRWTDSHRNLGEALIKLARHTRKEVRSEELDDHVLRRASDDDGLSQRTRKAVGAALEKLRDLDVSVLRHVDTSAQNCLFESGHRFVGLVDWETARTSGAPGWDVWNTAISYMEHSVGLKRWSTELVLDTFRIAWERSHFWAEARVAGRDAAAAAGVEERHHEALEIAFHARRLGRLLVDPHAFATGVPAARGMLETVCGH